MPTRRRPTHRTIMRMIGGIPPCQPERFSGGTEDPSGGCTLFAGRFTFHPASPSKNRPACDLQDMLTSDRIRRALGRRFRRLGKLATSFASGSGDSLPDIAWIMGCQRSGTTMLLDIFDRDLRVRAFRDVGALTTGGGAGSIRLNPLDQVEAEFRRMRSPFAVAKPLADGHRARVLLDRFPRSRIIWMYRDFRDVASSDLRYFGERNGIRNLAPMVDADPDNWRSAGVSDEVQAVVRRHFSEEMKPYDAGALFWYARNALFFEQDLPTHDRVLLLRYEEFTEAPEAWIHHLYRWLGQDFPGPSLVKEVHTRAVGRDRALDLSPEVIHLCRSMQERMDASAEVHRPPATVSPYLPHR